MAPQKGAIFFALYFILPTVLIIYITFSHAIGITEPWPSFYEEQNCRIVFYIGYSVDRCYRIRYHHPRNA